MKIKFLQLPESIQLLAQSNNSLKQALNRLEFGTPETKRSWFYENKSPEWILDSIVSKLKGMKELGNIAEWDLSKSDKFAPQGKSAPLRERLEGLNEYFEHLSSPKIVNDPLWKKAKLEAIRRLRLNGSGSPITLEQVVARGIRDNKYNTNSGYPDYGKRKSPDIIRRSMELAPYCIAERIPCTLGTRASMGKTGTAARSIFMAAMSVNIWGQRYQQPLQDYIRSLKLDFFLPWEGWEYVQNNISISWNHTNLKFGADYTKMDQHFNKYHALEVYDVVKCFFSRRYWEELKSIIEYVFEMPIITNLGLIDQPHAMPSGSEWTNFLETVWNFIFCCYLELKYQLKFYTAMGIGDDQLWILEGEWNAKSTSWIVDVVIQEFENAGLPGNPEKQEVSVNNTTFLQRYLTTDWDGIDGSQPVAGVYSLIRNVTSQVFPEFYHNEKEWDKSMFALRVIQIAENANQHPLFKWYVQQFIAKANDNILEFVRAGSQHWVETMNKAKKIANFLPTYNQAKQEKPLASFDTIKLLLEIT